MKAIKFHTKAKHHKSWSTWSPDATTLQIVCSLGPISPQCLIPISSGICSSMASYR